MTSDNYLLKVDLTEHVKLTADYVELTEDGSPPSNCTFAKVIQAEKKRKTEQIEKQIKHMQDHYMGVYKEFFDKLESRALEVGHYNFKTSF